MIPCAARHERTTAHDARAELDIIVDDGIPPADRVRQPGTRCDLRAALDQAANIALTHPYAGVQIRRGRADVVEVTAPGPSTHAAASCGHQLRVDLGHALAWRIDRHSFERATVPDLHADEMPAGRRVPPPRESFDSAG